MRLWLWSGIIQLADVRTYEVEYQDRRHRSLCSVSVHLSATSQNKDTATLALEVPNESDAYCCIVNMMKRKVVTAENKHGSVREKYVSVSSSPPRI